MKTVSVKLNSKINSEYGRMCKNNIIKSFEEAINSGFDCIVLSRSNIKFISNVFKAELIPYSNKINGIKILFNIQHLNLYIVNDFENDLNFRTVEFT